MMTTLLRHARTHAVAYLALFVALSGTSYAAVRLGKGAVKNKNIAANAVTSDKVKDGTLKAADFAKGQIPPGATGATGATGPQGPKGEKGDKGDTGTAGLSALATLPVGQTETGIFGIGGETESAGHLDVGSINFPVPLAAALAADHVVYVPKESSSATHCTGQGHAESGYLCVYETSRSGGPLNSGNILDPEFDPGAAVIGPGAGRHGFVLVQLSIAATPQDNTATGTWSVTG